MHRLISLVLSVYVAGFIYSNAFFVERLTLAGRGGELFWNHLAIFLVILLPVHLVINKFVVVYKSRGGGGIFRTAFLGAVLVGLVISIFYHVIPIETIYDLPTELDRIFASDMAFTIWLLIPLLALFI